MDTESDVTETSDPLAAVRALSGMARQEGPSLLVLVNFHRFLHSAEIIQAVARQVQLGKQNQTFLIILSPVVQLPEELEKLFVVDHHGLPDRDQLEQIAQGIATDDGEFPAGDSRDQVLESAAGLTRYEAENAFSLSLVRHGRIEARVIWEMKAQMLRKSGLLGLHRGNERFDQLGGLDNLKAFCLRAMRRLGNRDPKLHPRGVLLLSPPGCGKSQLAKSLGNETGRPTLTLDVGTLLGSLVGQSEQNLRQALRIAEAMSPCVLLCDEIEKGLAGVGGDGQGDSGVSSRLFGHLLTWLADREADVFVVATANNIAKLPPEVARAERFDALFFLDFPGAQQRSAIWEIYLNEFGIDTDQPRPSDDGWSGAEIRACCRLAALLDVSLMQAATNIVPVSVTARESVQSLRQWASGRCLSADQAGIYTAAERSRSKSRRRIPRDPSVN
jgi:hypothetical protein